MKPLYLFIFITVFASFAFPEDWPGFGGINGDFKSLEKDINTNWDKKEPLQIWTAKVGLGFSSIIEAEGFAYLAARILNGQPVSLPTTTGTAPNTLSGSIYKRAQDRHHAI